MIGSDEWSLLVAGLAAVAVVASYGLAWYSWRQRDHPVSNRFAAVLVADGTWALVTFLGFVSPTDGVARLWELGMGGIGALAGVLWFMFVVEYTGDSDRIPPLVERLAVGQAVVYGVVYAVNPGGLAYTGVGVTRWGLIRLPYEQLGPIALVELAVVYALLLASFGLLGRFFLRTRNLYRKQTGFIFGSALVVVVANVAFFGGLSPHPRLDLTPLFFVVQAIGVGIALYYYDFLDVAPMAATTLLEELSDPVFVVDNDERVVDHNHAAAAYVEDGDDAESERPMLSDVTIEGLADVLVRADGGTGADAARPGTGGTEVTTVNERGGRLQSVTYDVRVTGITDRYGMVRGYALVLRDVTDRIAQKRALKTQNRRLEEFTGVVSHDLRNPLGILDGYVELTRETGDLEHLDAASDSVDRMKTLIDDLLRLAREGQAIDETEEVSLADCSRRAWTGVETGGATLMVEADCTVVADESRLRQVFENLFRNAIEHGDEAVTVTVGEFSDGFYVADDGPGIPESDRDRVFELGETTSPDGTGFGLAIVERIVEAHGWEIGVTTGDDGGARFEITELYSTGVER